MACSACPFALTDESESVQNLGCLPTPGEILQMKRQCGHNWSCHESTPEKPKLCAGMVEWVSEMPSAVDIDIKSGGLIRYDDWWRHGPEAAMKMAVV